MFTGMFPAFASGYTIAEPLAPSSCQVDSEACDLWLTAFDRRRVGQACGFE